VALDTAIPGRHEQVVRTLGSHTAWCYGFTRHPWTRLASRLGRAVEAPFVPIVC